MHSIITKLFHLTGMLEVLGNREVAEYNITINQYELLWWIGEGFVTNSSLQTMTGQTKENVSLKIKKLEGKGLLFRTIDYQDKRIQYFHLTEYGKQITYDCNHKITRSLEDSIGDEMSENKRAEMNIALERMILLVSRIFSRFGEKQRHFL